MHKTRLLSLVLTSTLGSVTAFGQSYNAFNLTQGIYGVHVSSNGLTDTVSLDPGAYLLVSNVRYDITDIFGFWNMSGTSDPGGSGPDQSGWAWNSHSVGGGYIAGWTNNPKDNDIQPGGQLSFTYGSLNRTVVDDHGFHFSLAQNFSGSNTAYFRGPLIPVPEPATLVVFGAGAITLLLRKRKGARS